MDKLILGHQRFGDKNYNFGRITIKPENESIVGGFILYINAYEFKVLITILTLLIACQG